MKKRVISFLSVFLLAFSLAVASRASSGGLENFRLVNTYYSGRFSDLGISEWYAMYVEAGYEYGLFSGRPTGEFAPRDGLTAAEAVKVASCLHKIYLTGKADFPSLSPWYAAYEDYALKNGLIDKPLADSAACVTRAQFAEMVARALPDNAFAQVNSVDSDSIPDVSLSDAFGPSVYKLYRAGVLTGCDSFGTFRPFDRLTRAEAAAIAVRACDISFRKSLELPVPLSGAELYRRCAPAVFYLERYDTEGALTGIGSGFFITRDGLAVTNYHVIDGAASAKITMPDGSTYDVKGVCGYDKKADVALLQVDGTGFSYLKFADSGTLAVGQAVYAIGSPFGLVNTISEGVISNAPQDIGGAMYIQFSAPISKGSGGGPVLDTYGRVVGVTCLTAVNGQTLNFAVPAASATALSRTPCVPLISIVAENAKSTVYYKGYFPVPDYGVFTGTPLYMSQLDPSTGVKTYYYRESDIAASPEVSVDGYVALLKQNGFEWSSSYTSGETCKADVYYNESFDLSVHFGTDSPGGIPCRFVAIHGY